MKALYSLNKYFWKYRWRLFLGILFVAVSNLFAILPAQIIQEAIDTVLEATKLYKAAANETESSLIYNKLTSELLMFAGLVLGFALLKGFFLFTTRMTIIVMSRLIEYDMKNAIFEQYQNLELAFYRKNNTGDLMNRISDDVSKVRMYFGPAIMYTINLIVLFAFVITAMLNVNVELTIYVLTPLPLLSVGIYYVSNIINRKSEVIQRQLSSINTFVQEAFSGIRVIKAYNQQQDKETFFKDELEDYKNKNLDLVRVNAVFMPLMTLLIGISTIMTIFIGGLLAMEGKISMGNIAEFVIYVNMLTWPVASLGWVTSLVQRASASQQRINEFMDTKASIVNPTHEKMEIHGNIEFKNVSFTYPDSGIKALQNINLKIKAGESVAILGRTGSGKSSLAGLVSRLYDADSGTILIDGRDIKTLNLDVLRKSVGYVPQDVFLFSESIAENIAFGTQLDVSQEEIEQAAKNAEIYKNIQSFPKGFETKLGERGITISGGQKQRISIARAIVGKPKILIFDDCLSAVDTETEKGIINNLTSVMKDKTTLIISHRVSSVAHCDQIFVLDDGTVLEQGTHTSLMTDENSSYATLYRKQLTEDNEVVGD
ncbi:MAG: ABC transporter ATP-binding protein [Salibacteraceae bacterium]|nr:ABC transporter ATP-binding protein [Salibacteraceae bacterium]|tara:strand:- start:432 stop:2231 length:1800 start_codon:yes stop_codon:yes gene_type:complete